MLNDLKVDKSGRNIFFRIHIFQSTSPTKLKILDLQKNSIGLHSILPAFGTIHTAHY